MVGGVRQIDCSHEGWQTTGGIVWWCGIVVLYGGVGSCGIMWYGGAEKETKALVLTSSALIS